MVTGSKSSSIGLSFERVQEATGKI
jgi:hypothetical protein